MHTDSHKTARTRAHPRVLVVEDVAQILDLGHGAVRRLLVRGELPGRKVGKRWRILSSELERFLAQAGRE